MIERIPASRLLICALLLVFGTAHAAPPAKFTNKAGQSVAFPDVCRTHLSHSSESAPLPYPNMVENASADFEPGEYPLRQGGLIQITLTNYLPDAVSRTSPRSDPARTKGGANAKSFALKVPVEGIAPVTIKTPPQSTLYELKDGSYCAVCVFNRRITSVLRLYPLKEVTLESAPTRILNAP